MEPGGHLLPHRPARGTTGAPRELFQGHPALPGDPGHTCRRRGTSRLVGGRNPFRWEGVEQGARTLGRGRGLIRIPHRVAATDDGFACGPNGGHAPMAGQAPGRGTPPVPFHRWPRDLLGGHGGGAQARPCSCGLPRRPPRAAPVRHLGAGPASVRAGRRNHRPAPPPCPRRAPMSPARFRAVPPQSRTDASTIRVVCSVMESRISSKDGSVTASLPSPKCRTGVWMCPAGMSRPVASRNRVLR